MKFDWEGVNCFNNFALDWIFREYATIFLVAGMIVKPYAEFSLMCIEYNLLFLPLIIKNDFILFSEGHYSIYARCKLS